jgi:hypothetical protein
MKKIVLSLGLIAVLGLSFTSCRDTKETNEAGNAIENDAVKATEDAAKDLKDAAIDAANDAVDATKKAGTDAIDAAKKAGTDAIDKIGN